MAGKDHRCCMQGRAAVDRTVAPSADEIARSPAPVQRRWSSTIGGTFLMDQATADIRRMARVRYAASRYRRLKLPATPSAICNLAISFGLPVTLPTLNVTAGALSSKACCRMTSSAEFAIARRGRRGGSLCGMRTGRNLKGRRPRYLIGSIIQLFTYPGMTQRHIAAGPIRVCRQRESGRWLLAAGLSRRPILGVTN